MNNDNGNNGGKNENQINKFQTVLQIDKSLIYSET